MPFKDSDQPIQIGLNVFYSQLLRFARICTTVNDFNFNVSLLTGTLKKRGFNRDELINTARKMCTQYPRILLRIQGCTKASLLGTISNAFTLPSQNTSP